MPVSARSRKTSKGSMFGIVERNRSERPEKGAGMRFNAARVRAVQTRRPLTREYQRRDVARTSSLEFNRTTRVSSEFSIN